MKPYAESGRAMQRRLAGCLAHLAPTEAEAEIARCRASLRGFKQVINTLGALAIVLTPLLGVLSLSPVVALLTALSFLLFICVLEVLECRVKCELEAARERGQRAKAATITF
jgi:hypothetical protein